MGYVIISTLTYFTKVSWFYEDWLYSIAMTRNVYLLEFHFSAILGINVKRQLR